ncbi:MAG TPA: AsmA family protein [Candidatus Binatia bacterium]
MKKALIAGATVFALLIATVIGLPTFVDLGRFKSSYLPLLEETLHRRVDVGEMRLRLVPRPSIKLSDLKISGTRKLPAESFFTAQEVQLRLELWPLLRGRFEITELVLDKPVFTLQKASKRSSGDTDLADKKIPANTGAEPNKLGPTPKLPDSAALALTIPRRLRIKDGQLEIVTEGRTPVHIHDIELSIEKFSRDRPFPYRASFNYPGLKTVTLGGQLEYQEQQRKLILKDNRLTLQNLTLPLEGSISSLNTGPRFDLVLADDDVDARPVMQILELFGLAPTETEISGPMGLRISVSGPSNNLMTRIQGQFKNVKLHGERAIKGNLNGAVSLRLASGAGPELIKQVQGNGKLSAREGELTNVDLVKKIQRATGAIGFSAQQRREATTFKTLDTEFILSDGVVEFKRIHLVNPQVELKGVGTMTLARQALNIGMDATLSPQASRKASRGRTSQFFKNQRGQLVVPLTVTGNAQNPTVDLDSGKLAQRGATRSMERSLGTFFRQLFHR